MDYFHVFLFTGWLSIGICLGGYPLMLGFYRYVLGGLSCKVEFPSLFTWGAIL